MIKIIGEKHSTSDCPFKVTNPHMIIDLFNLGSSTFKVVNFCRGQGDPCLNWLNYKQCICKCPMYSCNEIFVNFIFKTFIMHSHNLIPKKFDFEQVEYLSCK